MRMSSDPAYDNLRRLYSDETDGLLTEGLSGMAHAKMIAGSVTGHSSETDWLWLCSIKDLNWHQRMALLHYFGSPRAVREASDAEFADWERVGIKWIQKVRAAANESFLSSAMQELERHHVRFYSCQHPQFPEKLHHIADCPHGLFVRGALPDPNRPAVGIVGARVCSNYGKVIACDLAQRLAREGIPVISGLAHGIDGIAQQSAFENGGFTYGVLGCGPDICYPRQNIDLFLRLCSPSGTNGGILSEYACGVQPMKMNFPQRNRIISALSDVLVVIEARKGSGSLITADFALDQGKEVFAVPGRCSDERSEGCNHLIREGASIYLSSEDFMTRMKELWEDVGYHVGTCEGGEQDHSMDDSSPEISEGDDRGLTERILEMMDLEPVDAGTLCKRSGLSMSEVSGAILQLQLEGKISEVYRSCYARNTI